jgi:predicted Zn-ribbon and HTH transcriptional regulator
MIIAAVVVFALISLARKLFKKPADESVYMQKETCENCGWIGQASKHTKRCPKCNGEVCIS